ncbi:DCC1-like thiol-disulfide oxidoreductase family protein [Salinicola lusitanus]|uniref:DCC1-like thiol-disulfide oxidoreductase family protein n=1 Tax=Salinicola lusitanus TaxID=1949085 RepID=A0ABZ3CWY8_9GAMM|nr:DCC1-like thiol-disulfide oxidoreductase family protein [Salinicola sp. CR57]
MSSAPPIIDESAGGEAGNGLLLFDADCPFCRRSVRWLLARERPDSRLRIAGLEGSVSHRLGEHFGIDFARSDSIWCFADGEPRRNSDAVWRLAARLRGGWQRLEWLRWIPRPLRDGGYRLVGNHRHRLSSLGAARLEDHPRWVNHLSAGLCHRCGLPGELADEP